MRYTLCISFHTNNWVLASAWDIRQDFKSKGEIKPYLNMIDETVKKAVIFDNVNNKVEIIKE